MPLQRIDQTLGLYRRAVLKTQLVDSVSDWLFERELVKRYAVFFDFFCHVFYCR